MKKLFLLATIICTMALTACGSDATTTEYGTDNNVTESTVESTVEDTTEYVEDVVEETTEETVVEDTTEVAEETNNNAQPVDWTGSGEGQISIMYIDGTIYEAHKHENDPESLAFIRLNEEQNYECDSVTIGIKSYGDVFTYNGGLKPEDFNTTLYSENGKPQWLYRHDLWATKEIFAGATFSEDLSLFEYFFIETIGNDAYTINGMEFYTVQDFVDVFGKPYGIYYVYDGLDDAAKGDEARYYVYDYKVGECYIAVIFEMSNAEPGNCTINEIMVLNPAYEGNLEDNFYVTE